ncbi:MAG: sodium-dependent bicarbonate transport family permease, partial [Hydrogenovibrio sp.]|uniref:sodium-dependent bicarbonate transport family permease n=1 Tax=Hydrogenovibrio sp. TaxID=2065821 RepID=UPI0028707E3E
AIFWAIVLGFVIPIIGYALLRFRNKIDPLNAAAITAHYGSVSAGTFLTAIAFLEASGVSHESYPIIMMVMMESPAIIIGLVLAAMARKRLAANQLSADGTATMGAQEVPKTEWGPLIKEAFTNGSVLLLLGALIIGAIVPPEAMKTLCLFLLEMGMVAAKRLDSFKKVGGTLIAFGIIMPLIGGFIGIFVGQVMLGFSVGGTLLVAILSASASYIAVPPVMRFGVPEANPSYYLALSLGITFPFNVVVGIPLFYQVAKWSAGV